MEKRASPKGERFYNNGKPNFTKIEAPLPTNCFEFLKQISLGQNPKIKENCGVGAIFYIFCSYVAETILASEANYLSKKGHNTIAPPSLSLPRNMCVLLQKNPPHNLDLAEFLYIQPPSTRTKISCLKAARN